MKEIYASTVILLGCEYRYYWINRHVILLLQILFKSSENHDQDILRIFDVESYLLGTQHNQVHRIRDWGAGRVKLHNVVGSAICCPSVPWFTCWLSHGIIAYCLHSLFFVPALSFEHKFTLNSLRLLCVHLCFLTLRFIWLWVR